MPNPDFENEKEWRRFLVDELKAVKGEIQEVRKDVSFINSAIAGLKITVAGVTSFVSAIVAISVKKLLG